MALPSTGSELTPSIIAHELFDRAATTESRTQTVHELIALVGQDKARKITNIAFNIANGIEDITQNGAHSDQAIEPLIQSLEKSELLLNL